MESQSFHGKIKTETGEYPEGHGSASSVYATTDKADPVLNKVEVENQHPSFSSDLHKHVVLDM